MPEGFASCLFVTSPHSPPPPTPLWPRWLITAATLIACACVWWFIIFTSSWHMGAWHTAAYLMWRLRVVSSLPTQAGDRICARACLLAHSCTCCWVFQSILGSRSDVSQGRAGATHFTFVVYRGGFGRGGKRDQCASQYVGRMAAVFAAVGST